MSRQARLTTPLLCRSLAVTSTCTPPTGTTAGPSRASRPKGNGSASRPTCPCRGGLNAFAQMVFTALQRYGAVVTDYAGAVMLEAEQPSDWAEKGNSGTDPITVSWQGLPEYKVVADLPWSSLQAVAPPQD